MTIQAPPPALPQAPAPAITREGEGGGGGGGGGGASDLLAINRALHKVEWATH